MHPGADTQVKLHSDVCIPEVEYLHVANESEYGSGGAYSTSDEGPKIAHMLSQMMVTVEC